MAEPVTSSVAQLRVLVLGLNYAPETTGIAPYTTGLARHLAAQDHHVTVVTGHPHYPEWKLHAGYESPRGAEDDQGVRLLRVPHPVPRNPSGLSRAWMELVFATRAARHLIRQRPDVVVVVSPALLSMVPAILLRALLRYRVGTVVQDLYGAALSEIGVGGRLTARLVAWAEQMLFARADGIAVIHEVFRRQLVNAGIPAGRISVIPNWAHVTMPEKHDRMLTRRQMGWRDDELVALHAGNMGAKQGLEGLVDVARLAQERGSRVRVVLLGEGSRRESLAAQASGLSNLHLLDPLPTGDFEATLAAADCLLLHEKPGVVEMSVPSKLTTYFTAGRPIVAATSHRSGASSLMQAAGAGLIVEAGDAGAILETIERLARDPSAASEYGRKGKRYAAEHLTRDASLERLGAWIQVLRSQRRRPRREASQAPPTTKTLKVLRISGLSGPGPIAGGVWEVAELQAVALNNAGVAVQVLSGRLGGRGKKPQPSTAVAHHAFRVYRLFPGAGLRALFGPRLLLRIVRATQRADLIHVDWCRDITTCFALVAARLLRTPVVVQTHGMMRPGEGWALRCFDRLVTRRLISIPTAFLTLTEDERNQLVQLGATDERLHRVVNAVADAPSGTPDPEPTIVFLARLHRRKNPLAFLQAVEIAISRGADFRALLIGPDAGEGNSVQEAIRNSPYADKISYAGQLDHDQALRILSHAWALVLPSHNEPYPLSVIEAAAFGVPSILSNTCGLAHEIQHRNAGVLLDRLDPASIAEAIHRILDPVEREMLGAQAQRLQRDEWSLSILADALVGIYNIARKESDFRAMSRMS